MTDDMDLASNGTPIDTLTEEDWETPYSLSKFDTVAAEKVYAWTLDSNQNDECGNSTDWNWWAARFNGSADQAVLGAGVIVEEISHGDVTAVRYTSVEELDEEWKAREKQYDEYRHTECKDGMECEGCFSCENC